MRLSRYSGYWGGGTALAVAAGVLGFTGHGLVARTVDTLTGQAWLFNATNSSVSRVDGYSGKTASQVGVGGLHGPANIVNSPNGAVIIDGSGGLTKVNNDDFTTSGPIRLFSGASTTAASGAGALYAVDQAQGLIQQLDDSGNGLKPIGPRISVGASVTSPVVAPDGSLYAAVPSEGDVAHVKSGRLNAIADVSHPTDQLSLVLAGNSPVAVDLTAGTAVPIGQAAVAGPATQLPAGFQTVQVAGSSTHDGVVALIGNSSVQVLDTQQRAVEPATQLQPHVAPTAAAMVGDIVVLINAQGRNILVVNTSSHSVEPPIKLTGNQTPDSLAVVDSLVFVNGSGGSGAVVVNSTGSVTPVSKYLPPPPPKPLQVKTPPTTPPPTVPPKSGNTNTYVPSHGRSAKPSAPGAPQRPTAIAGNATATVGWGAAAPDGSAITSYVVTWTGSAGDTGSTTVPGTALSANVTGLSNGTTYTFTIAAVNGVGKGPAATTPPVTPSSEVPDAPGAVTATTPQGDGSVTLTWTPADHGYHVASYTVWQYQSSGSPVALQTGITGTTVTLGNTQGIAVGTPIQFQVSAVGPSGATGTLSAPTAAVTPYDPPNAPTVAVGQVAQDGSSATVNVSCDTTCQQGRPPASYSVAVGSNSPITVTANSDGSQVSVPISNLTPNQTYNVSVTVKDTAGLPSSAAGTAVISTPGPPAVSGIGFNVSGLNITVTANVNTGGLATNCYVTINGTSINQGGSCSGITVSVPTYNTNYIAQFFAQNPDGSQVTTGSFTSGLKPLTADASTAFGSCPGGTYCGADSHAQPDPHFVKNRGTIVTGGTPVQASCYTVGGPVQGIVSGWTGTYTLWVDIPGLGYMNQLYFPSPDSVTAGLPGC